MYKLLFPHNITSLSFLSRRLHALRGVFSETRKSISWNPILRKNYTQQHSCQFSENRIHSLNVFGYSIFYWTHQLISKWAAKRAWINSGYGGVSNKSCSIVKRVTSPRWTVKGFSLSGLLGFFWPEEELTVEETAILSMKKALLAIQRERFDLAQKHLAQSLSTCQLHGLEDGITQVLDMQANLAIMTGELERAENLFKTVVQRLVNQGKVIVTDNAIIEISIKLSDLYNKLGRVEEAIVGLFFCINIQRHKIHKELVEDENTLLLAGWALETLSNIFLNSVVGNPDDAENKAKIMEAKSLAEEANAYATKGAGPYSIQAVSTRNNVALATSLLGDYETALSILQELEEICREREELQPLYPNIVVSIGNVYIQKSELESAAKVCGKGRSLASRFKDNAAFERAQECIQRCKQIQKDMSNAQKEKA